MAEGRSHVLSVSAAMTGHRGGPTTTTTPTTTTNRRLSRSFKLSQQQHTQACSDKSNAPSTPKSEFKTPTRPSFCGESPHDSDAHHEIIWDATSPQRLGKRATKVTAGAVSISDIVSRIAPQHGRPEVSEPDLQQWIGDSAGIPCTPDVGPPKSRRKSPRCENVEQLLRLAKQFDLNLLGSDDDREDAPADGDPRSAEDDLWGPEDDLFEEPARQASAAPVAAPPEDVPATPGADLADDWADDDLLDDPLLVEMTQNPEKFCTPAYTSTQMSSYRAPPMSPAVSQSDGRTTLEKLADCSDPSRSSRAAPKDPTAAGGLSDAVSTAANNCTSPGPAHERVPTVSDFPDDDLDAIFSSEPLWDELDDDDDEMLRQLCEDVEKRMGAADAAGKGSPGGGWGPRAVAVTTAPASSSLPQQRPAQRFSFKRPGQPVAVATNRLGRPATNHPVSTVTSKPVSMATNQLGSSATNRPVPMATNRPVSMATHHPVPMVTGKATVAKCSALEIERKKQEAVQRRRRRLQQLHQRK
ncbi:ewing's tumor-associated antigen 1 isoform X2 [Festucalex cinctus]